MVGWLRIADRARWLLLGPLAAADTHEVAWVSTQRWRGVASHFNEASTLDYRLFLAGAAAIAVTVTVIAALPVLAFTVMRALPPWPSRSAPACWCRPSPWAISRWSR